MGNDASSFVPRCLPDEGRHENFANFSLRNTDRGHKVRGASLSPRRDRNAIPIANSKRESDMTKVLSNQQRTDAEKKRVAPLVTPTDLDAKATRDVAAAMNAILADVFALYMKTKNFHWHMSGPHFRDYHLLLDEQSDQIFAMSDVIAERCRKIGRPTLKSIGEIARTQRIKDNDADYVEPSDMLAELQEDNKTLAAELREVHELCNDAEDFATASLIENWIDETERRTWFLFESNRRADTSGH